MLLNILQKINSPLSRVDFARILFALIQRNCDNIIERINIEPYNQLKPILNEHYTLTFIKSLKSSNYSINEVTSILVHLYQYSHVSGINRISSIQLQPYVTLNINENGKYIFNYNTYKIHEGVSNLLTINDFKFISEPIEYIERPCIVDVNTHQMHIDEMEILYSPEKCDQYLAFQLMLSSNNNSPATNTNTQTNRIDINMPSTSRQKRVNELNKTSRSIFTKAYRIGYYYHGLNVNKGSYTFDMI